MLSARGSLASEPMEIRPDKQQLAFRAVERGGAFWEFPGGYKKP